VTQPAQPGEFTYRRVHRASRELLFDCMTQPEHLTQFWGPAGTTAPAGGITVDLRPGGAFETTTITFTDLGDGTTEVVTHQTNVPAMFATPESLAGFQTSLDRFARYVTTLAGR
jgi:uncharacterized protein YndB with AHSA1/START domain